MGCDIHVVVEQRHEGKWIGVHDCPPVRARGSNKEMTYAWHEIGDRNYTRFGLLAGVRSDGPEPRGFPSDASDLASIRGRSWHGDGHSHSWTTAYELIPIMMETAGDKDRATLAAYLLDSQRAAAEYVMHRWLAIDRSVDPEDVRIVYWFDN